jgi:hypothetical protein
MTKILTIKKAAAAGRSFGRGMDNYRTPARYEIFFNDRLIGSIVGKRVGYMDSGTWEIYYVEAATGLWRPAKTFYIGGRKAAVEWVHAETPRLMCLHHGTTPAELDEIDRRIAAAVRKN